MQLCKVSFFIASIFAKITLFVRYYSPGPIRTNIGRSVGVPKLLLDDTSELSNHTIMQRNGEPDEVANLILFLASNETASYITGVNNLVDGGYMCL